MTKSKRLAFFLPNTFTALNMACGFVSILLSTSGRIYEASMILILGAIFDSVDGRVARMTGTSSSFGEQFDSLSDLISFGIAPSILVYQRHLYQFGRLGIAVSFIFLLCVALRLARFNANIEKVSNSYFQGLPSPGAALAIIGAVLFSTEFNFVDHVSILFLPYTLFYGFLMIITIPFYSFKDSTFIKKHRKLSLFILLVSAALMASYYQVLLPLIMFCYVIACLIYYLKNRKNILDLFEWTDENE